MNLKTTVKKLLEELLLKMEADFNNVNVQDDGSMYRINIESDNPSILIGRHGETIYALQNILKTLAWKQSKGKEFNVVVDIDNYRKRQEENVINLAERKAQKVRKSGEEEKLPPMSPYFRRVVHLHLKEKYKDLDTESRGDGDRRQVVIKPK